jgi:hypothetical protein
MLLDRLSSLKTSGKAAGLGDENISVAIFRTIISLKKAAATFAGTLDYSNIRRGSSRNKAGGVR